GAGPFAGWQEHPYQLKQIGDEAFALGINQYVIHYSVHQAYEGFRPGFAMGPWGIHLDRMNTWWKQSRPWLDYIARCQHMLRQGQFVADVLYFPGEGAPHYFGKRETLGVPLPEGYDYDGCDRETLLRRLSVEDGRLVVPSGMSYRYLMLSADTTMTPELARRIGELVEAGAKVIGPRPGGSPSLRDYPRCDEEVRRIAAELWGTGRVISGKTFEEIAAADGLAPDFAFTTTSEDAKVHYLHRRTADMDLYFVANGADAPVRPDATFRVAGRRPELWDPETGGIVVPAVFEDLGDRVRLPLDLDRLQSVFVVFRSPLPKDSIVGVTAQPAAPAADGADPAIRVIENRDGSVAARVFRNGNVEFERSSGAVETLEVSGLSAPRPLAGPWQLRFPAGWDAPEEIQVEKLISWTEHEQPGVKYFSGTATYQLRFEGPPKSESKGSGWLIDLGDVGVIARVKLNGRDLGTLWKPPFRVEAGEALVAGENRLEVEVTNTWSNRLIGDEQYPDDAEWEGIYLKSWPDWFREGKARPELRRKAFSVVKHYGKESPLERSGLLGPVVLIPWREVAVPPAAEGGWAGEEPLALSPGPSRMVNRCRPR
ncbi:MAG: glycosyl hydrolase, partial [Thermoguttaceae bacterium]